MTGGFSKPRGERAVGHDRSDSRHPDRHSGQQVCAQLPESTRHPRVLELGSRRRISRPGHTPLIVVVSRDDRHAMCCNAERSQLARSGCRSRRSVEEAED